MKCSDDTLYTGITTDVSRRINEHNTSPRGAVYTSLRRPVTLHFYKEVGTRSVAMKEELRIKKLPRVKKLAMTSTIQKEAVKKIVKRKVASKR